MSKRNRPGKRERQRPAIEARAAIVRANQSEPKPKPAVYGAPKGIGSSTLARRSLQAHSHDIGFVGPRGYNTPRDLVSKREQVEGAMAPRARTQAEREAVLSVMREVTAEDYARFLKR